ncbi:unnamed protein product [Heligmosomoides polygyrus]|uniref:Lig_chan-Glu_bd domain-containing protein n=1 Tax=Heligmosomoides polygyrus TaxID=6339 RepID=A0A183GV86_HELPZ|nr:unnamed protein product [Heligmosomoides polygyrus]
MQLRTPSSDEQNNNDLYEGYCIDLLRKVAEMNKFNYTIHEVKDKAYGIREANGKWNGMVGELMSGVSCFTRSFTVFPRKTKVAQAEWADPGSKFIYLFIYLCIEKDALYNKLGALIGSFRVQPLLNNPLKFTI